MNSQIVQGLIPFLSYRDAMAVLFAYPRGYTSVVSHLLRKKFAATVQQHLALFSSNVQSHIEILIGATPGLHISGSTLLTCILGEKWTGGDIDFMVLKTPELEASEFRGYMAALEQLSSYFYHNTTDHDNIEIFRNKDFFDVTLVDANKEHSLQRFQRLHVDFDFCKVLYDIGKRRLYVYDWQSIFEKRAVFVPIDNSHYHTIFDYRYKKYVNRGFRIDIVNETFIEQKDALRRLARQNYKPLCCVSNWRANELYKSGEWSYDTHLAVKMQQTRSWETPPNTAVLIFCRVKKQQKRRKSTTTTAIPVTNKFAVLSSLDDQQDDL